MEWIDDSNYGMTYETPALSAIRQADIPTEWLHADTTTISFYGDYDVDLSVLDEVKQEECILRVISERRHINEKLQTTTN